LNFGDSTISPKSTGKRDGATNNRKKGRRQDAAGANRTNGRQQLSKVQSTEWRVLWDIAGARLSLAMHQAQHSRADLAQRERASHFADNVLI
jgi:hypothetical protein